jgi:hypothetical protein
VRLDTSNVNLVRFARLGALSAHLLGLIAPPLGQPGTNVPLGSLGAMDSVATVAQRLGRTGYLCDDALATVTYLSLTMQRPLLVEGEPGTGKTALA